MSRKKPIDVKDRNSAALLLCPFYAHPRKTCDTVDCMAWNSIDDVSGYCNLIERSE